MPHSKARLNINGRRLLVERIRVEGWKVAHAAKAMGISRQCAHHWLKRYDQHGEAGLHDRSSRPHTMPRRTNPQTEARVLAHRAEHRQGPARTSAATGVPARTVSAIWRRHHLPPLTHLDPITGAVIRGSQATTRRYERQRPGELIHVAVKKIGKIPDGGGWRLHGRAATSIAKNKRTRIGYDYVHAAVDDHSRLAYVEIHDDEKGSTCAAFLTRAAAFFASQGIGHIERVITDNAFAYWAAPVIRSGRCVSRRFRLDGCTAERIRLGLGSRARSAGGGGCTRPSSRRSRPVRAVASRSC